VDDGGAQALARLEPQDAHLHILLVVSPSPLDASPCPLLGGERDSEERG